MDNQIRDEIKEVVSLLSGKRYSDAVGVINSNELFEIANTNDGTFCDFNYKSLAWTIYDHGCDGIIFGFVAEVYNQNGVLTEICPLGDINSKLDLWKN